MPLALCLCVLWDLMLRVSTDVFRQEKSHCHLSSIIFRQKKKVIYVSLLFRDTRTYAQCNALWDTLSRRTDEEIFICEKSH